MGSRDDAILRDIQQFLNLGPAIRKYHLRATHADDVDVVGASIQFRNLKETVFFHHQGLRMLCGVALLVAPA